MATNQVEYKNDGIYYNQRRIGDDQRSIRLENQTIDTGVVAGDIVDYHTTENQWIKITDKFKSRAVYEGNNTIVTFGECNISGLTKGPYYASDDGGLTRNPNGVKIGFAISATQLLVDIDVQEGNTIAGESGIVAEVKTYGGTGADGLIGIVEDGSYLYMSGYNASEGQGLKDAMILKYDKDLNLAEKTIYGGADDDLLYTICSDGTFLYTVGHTKSEGQGDYDMMILKLDKNLSIQAKKIYGGVELEQGIAVCVLNSNIYTIGITRSEGVGSQSACVILKMDTDLNISIKKLYSGTWTDYFHSVCTDGTNVYAAGWTSSEGAGGTDTLIVKYDENLNILAKKTYGGSDWEQFYGSCSDGTFVYAVGYTKSTGNATRSCFIVKYDSNLNVIKRKTLGGNFDDSFEGAYSDGTYIYATGFAKSPRNGIQDTIIAKYDKDLNLINAKIFGGNGSDILISCVADSDKIYTVGYAVETYQNSLILKLDKNLPTGDFSSTPANFVYQDANLVETAPNFVLADSNLTPLDSSLTEAVSNLTEATSNLTETSYNCQ